MEKKWWMNEIAYQIYPKSFNDSNDDGIGDIPGIIEKLDYLKGLGVTLLWICPVYNSPMDDNGYDISDYMNIYPAFGTMADMDNLLEEAKKREIKVIMDLVINHCSDEHRWFQEALHDKNSKYRDYFIFKEGKNGNPPTNWRSVFGGSVWEKVPGEDNMYYFHSFSKKQPDFNWENPAMRKEIYQMICFWLEKGIAGFRVDAINFIKKDQRFQDGEPDGVDGLVACFDYCRNIKGINVFYDELKKETFDKYNCMTVSESVGTGYDIIDECIGEKGCFSMMFDFNYINMDIRDEDYFKPTQWTVKELRDKIYLSQTEIQKIGWSAPFLENHDQPRSINKFIKDPQYYDLGAKTLATLFFMLRGTPFIYQGQELGMVNFQRSSVDEFNDLNAHSQYHRAIAEGFSEKQALAFLNQRSRDNARTPMPWTDEKYGGFSKHEPWLAMNDHFEKYNAQSQIRKHGSTYEFYRKLIDIRKNQYHDILTYGQFIPLIVNDQIISYIREYDDQQIAVLCNLTSQDQPYDLDNIDKIILNNIHDYIPGQLKPYQAIIVKLNKKYQ